MNQGIDYWNSFYSSAVKNLDAPSQFAALVVQELAGIRQVVDLGAGNLRDSKFFHAFGMRVLSIDSSEVAMAGGSVPGFETGVHRFGGDALEVLQSKLASFLSPGPVLVYGRFFLHAIDEVAQQEVFELVRWVFGRFAGSTACFEFRTTEDQERLKVTGPHYRRFIRFDDFLNSMVDEGFTVDWSAQGRGMAKWGDDDAVVGRVFLSLERSAAPRL